MKNKDIKVKAADGRQFDLHFAMPEDTRKVPAIVLCSAIHGVDADLKAIAAEFAAQGYLAAAPDLFSRSVPGPLPHEDPRAKPRGQPRLAAQR